MDAELKTKWTTALRSGEFKQAYGRLKDTNRKAYCCLGVLAIISNPKTRFPSNENDSDNDPYPPIDAMIGGIDVRRKLTDMNDEKGCSFAEIADYIEKTL